MDYPPINDRLEKVLTQTGYDAVIGIDEVGRGSWAGPVVVGAFVFSKDSKLIPDVNDSKKLTRKSRIRLYEELKDENFSIAQSEVDEVDELNVLQATRLAIVRAVSELKVEGRVIALIDGYFREQFDFEHRFIIKGDTKHYSIAAASILAKVYRDNLMVELASSYPDYGFETNVGYGTKRHREALEKYGVCDIHRKSYKPIKRLLDSRMAG
ncbi:ribonuclease HII [Candidatus Dojkabacteria bacterium]|nr:ribonuclease HII [Candidatus Dojkabacteria bacterium]